jgi:hypothetical protein
MVPFIDLERQDRGIEKEILSATRRVFEKGRFIEGVATEMRAFTKRKVVPACR